MATTTTLKLSDELKARISVAAEAANQSPHAFMVEALAAQTALAERRQAFVADALLAEQEVAEYGLVHDADEVFSYLQSKLSGADATRPVPKKLLP
ncbi:hypothetical protein [Ferriphaselus sp. R-1]|uniref:CopG family ribbon-helix-helix protein n=1 Tax=Ferriphaselus sp. R-1 TaxID=1485544 RepID=UPI00054FA580|nr:hypothetical protein [Ferriphaselus sp. R-1]